MARSVFLLSLAVCASLQGPALAARLAKRQSTCEATELPEDCREILTLTVEGAAYVDPTSFLSTYCSETCAEPLYNYLVDCDPTGSRENATKFDFLCSSSGDGNPCLPPLVTQLTAEDSFVYECLDPLPEDSLGCTPRCQDALDSAYESLGCCLYSFYAVTAGSYGASALFGLCSDDPRTLCVGGATGAPIDLPEPPLEVDPQCEDLAEEEVSESCRYLLGTGAIETAYIYPDDLCSASCGVEVWEFYRDCGELTGDDNATVVDVLCATNSKGQRCRDLIGNLAEYDLDACEGIDGTTCPAACRQALQDGVHDMGCCFLSLLQVFSDGDDVKMYVPLLSAFCDVDFVDNCLGLFSNEPAPPPPENECALLAQSLVPDECREYTSINYIFAQAYSNPTQFKAELCDSTCARPVYEYFLKCDMMTGSNNASGVDFLCATNDRGSGCAGILSDSALQGALDTACSETTDTMCSLECSSALQLPSTTWGCCLFTLTAFDYNVSYVEDIVEECNLEVLDAEVCIGGISRQPVAVPGQPTVPPTVATCNSQYEAIPEGCGDVFSYLPLANRAYTDPENFLTTFCKTDCAKSVYEYFQCINKTEASYIDFLCSKSVSGTECARLVSDPTFLAAVDGTCKDISDKQCSQPCQTAYQGFDKAYGCCLYTYSALDSNVTYSRALSAQCGVDDPDLCDGGISNAPISAPGSDVESAALATVLYSSLPLLLLPALLLTMLA